MQQAIAAIHAKTLKSICKAASYFTVLPSTLGHRLNGRVMKNTGHECDQNLTHVEEAELERWITELIRYGYPA